MIENCCQFLFISSFQLETQPLPAQTFSIPSPWGVGGLPPHPFLSLKCASLVSKERCLSHGTTATSYIAVYQLACVCLLSVYVCEQQMTDVYPLLHCLFILQCKLMPLIYY